MSVYTVHEPPPRADDPEPERFAFVRDGFHFRAFVFGPLWLLWHRLWLVLLLYVLATSAVQIALWALGISAAVKFTVGFLIALLVGFEAGSFRRWTLARRRWTNIGLVVAPNLEAAERRFFDRWTARNPVTAAAAPNLSATPPAPSNAWMTPASPQIVGLFPEPQPRR